jgi:hypothetical protein
VQLLSNGHGAEQIVLAEAVTFVGLMGMKQLPLPTAVTVSVDSPHVDAT